MNTARWINLIVGLVFVLVGIWGLIPAAGGMAVGLFPLNTVLAVGSVLAGAILLYGVTSTNAAHGTSAVMGIILVLVALVGLFSRNLLGLGPVNGWSIALYAVAAVVLLYDWLATPPSRQSHAS